jgi:glutathione peroxidase
MLHLLLLSFFLGSKNSSDESPSTEFLEIFQLTQKDLSGQPVPFSDWRGKVILVVNTASECGFTKQYEELQNLHERYQEQGLVVVGFPSDNFGGQELDSNEEIRFFCEENYQVRFPLLSKSNVKKEPQNPAFEKLIAESKRLKMGGGILWNFEKFLIDREGRLVSRYRSTTSPSNKALVAEIEKALSKAPVSP